MEREDMDISLEGRFLTIRGIKKASMKWKRKISTEQREDTAPFPEPSNFLWMWIMTKSALPTGRRGVLKLNLPKIKKDAIRQIDIKASE